MASRPPPSPKNDMNNDIKLKHIKHVIRRMYEETATTSEHLTNDAIVVLRDSLEDHLLERFLTRDFPSLSDANYGDEAYDDGIEAIEDPPGHSDDEIESSDDGEMLTSSEEEHSGNETFEWSDSESLPETVLASEDEEDKSAADDDETIGKSDESDGQGDGQSDGSGDGEPAAKKKR
jgi:hypothetical protein